MLYCTLCNNNFCLQFIKHTVYYSLRSVSGILDVIEELVDVNVVTDGGLNGNVSPVTYNAKIF